MAEAKKACEILKAGRLYAGQQNGHAIVDNAHYEELAKLLVAEKPDAVFTQWPIDNHRDHRAITALVYDAVRHAKRKFARILLRGLQRRGHTTVLPHTLRGHN